MSSPIFDTHAYVRRLVEAGVPEPQAEVLAMEHARIFGEHMATKGDIEASAASLRRDMKEIEYRLLIKLGGMVTVAIGAFAALTRALAG